MWSDRGGGLTLRRHDHGRIWVDGGGQFLVLLGRARLLAHTGAATPAGFVDAGAVSTLTLLRLSTHWDGQTGGLSEATYACTRMLASAARPRGTTELCQQSIITYTPGPPPATRRRDGKKKRERARTRARAGGRVLDGTHQARQAILTGGVANFLRAAPKPSCWGLRMSVIAGDVSLPRKTGRKVGRDAATINGRIANTDSSEYAVVILGSR